MITKEQFDGVLNKISIEDKAEARIEMLLGYVCVLLFAIYSEQPGIKLEIELRKAMSGNEVTG